jgi:hypothetical protein
VRFEVPPVRYAMRPAGSDLTYEDLGEHRLKGVPDPWQLFRVVA